jgi:hypothetical protein
VWQQLLIIRESDFTFNVNDTNTILYVLPPCMAIVIMRLIIHMRQNSLLYIKPESSNRKTVK